MWRERKVRRGRGGCEGEQGMDYKGPRRSWKELHLSSSLKGRCLCSGSGPRGVVGWQDMEVDAMSRGMPPEFVRSSSRKEMVIGCHPVQVPCVSKRAPRDGAEDRACCEEQQQSSVQALALFTN